MELRALVSTRNASAAWDHLRCEVRERLITFLQKEMPEALPEGERCNRAAAGCRGRPWHRA